MMKLTIDGSEVEAAEGTSVLDAALDAGIFIPHLCKHPDLEAVGGCRLCAVEVNGSGHAVPACKTTVEEGMVVDSHAACADHVRRMAAAFEKDWHNPVWRDEDGCIVEW